MRNQFEVSWDVLDAGSSHIPRLLIRDGSTWHAYTMPRQPTLDAAMVAAKRYAAVTLEGLRP